MNNASRESANRYSITELLVSVYALKNSPEFIFTVNQNAISEDTTGKETRISFSLLPTYSWELH